MKKGKSDKKDLQKSQSKQLKILMKKNEAFNEVPLKQFIEFFLKSQVSMQIDYFEYFLAACKNICVIDVVETEDNGQVTTIKLKNSVLRELILESKSEHNEKASNTWQTEYKKRINEFQFQNDLVMQLLDILIN